MIEEPGGAAGDRGVSSSPLGDAVLERALGGHMPDDQVASAALALRSMRFGRLVERSLQELLRPTGLERSEFSVLSSLLLASPEQGQSPSELSRTVVQTTSGMTKTVNRLERRGLVVRRRSADDARRVDIVLTGEGRRITRDLLTGLVAGFSHPLTGADADAAERLAEALVGVMPVLEQLRGVVPTGRPGPGR